MRTSRMVLTSLVLLSTTQPAFAEGYAFSKSFQHAGQVSNASKCAPAPAYPEYVATVLSDGQKMGLACEDVKGTTSAWCNAPGVSTTYFWETSKAKCEAERKRRM